MKFQKTFLAVIAAISIALPAVAQMDAYGSPRKIVLAAPRILDATAATFTNGPIDIHGFQGIASVTISSFTNAGGALTAQLFTSADNTNITALANYSKAVATSVIATNLTYGSTNLQFTQTYLMPGNLTNQTASSVGFASQFVDPAPFTNSGALTITAKNLYQIGFKPGDANRYLYIVFTPTGSSSNDTVSADFTGYRTSEVR